MNPRARVAGGVTAPRGSTGGVSPVAWIRGMRAARARLDAYAHHPYPSSNRETPFAGGCAHCATITMATLERLLTEVGRAFGPKRIWLTEYGYQTGSYGVSQQRQAELIGQSGLRVHRAPRVDMLIHYLVKDEPQCRPLPERALQQRGPGEARSARLPASDRAGRPQRRQARPLGPGAAALGRPALPRPGADRQHLALQRRRPDDQRARVPQHRGAGAEGHVGANLLAAGRRVQRDDPRSLAER